MTAETPAPRANIASLLAAAPTFEAMRPSLTSLMGNQFTSATAGLGSIVLEQFDMPGISRIAADMAPTASLSKMIAEQYSSSVGSIGQALAQMHRAQFDAMFQSVELKKAMESFNRSFMKSVSASNVSELLSQAASLRGILEDQRDINDFAAEFLEEQPELAERIDELPFLITLSSTDRRLIVWFMTVVVAFYVTMGLGTINANNPDLHSLLGDLGIGGLSIGAAAGAGTKKLLDKLPTDEDE